jgi:cobalt/nickel transport system permease protein
MLRAHALRVPDHPRPTLRTLRSLLGQLLVRSLGRAERVHVAMLCRGFDGELRRKSPMRFGSRDALFVAGSGSFLLLVRLVNVPYWLGSLFW